MQIRICYTKRLKKEKVRNSWKYSSLRQKYTRTHSKVRNITQIIKIINISDVFNLFNLSFVFSETWTSKIVLGFAFWKNFFSACFPFETNAEISKIVERLQRKFWYLVPKHMKIYILGDCYFNMLYA